MKKPHSSWMAVQEDMFRAFDSVDDCDPPFEAVPSMQVMCDKLIALELETRTAVDALARQLARGNPLQMNQGEQFFLKQRLYAAVKVPAVFLTPLAGNNGAFVPEPSAELETVLEWLLIDVWSSCLCPDWQLLTKHRHLSGRRQPDDNN